MGWLPWAASDQRFFEFFEQHAAIATECSHQLVRLVSGEAAPAATVARIHELESAADVVTHRCVAALHGSYATELRRNDIHKLISRLDDIVDAIDAAADAIDVCELAEMTADVGALADVVRRAAELVALALPGLRSLKNPEELLGRCVLIGALESEADQLLRGAVTRLLEAGDAMQVIKWKGIYELLETATDHCEDVANVLEGIVLENS